MIRYDIICEREHQFDGWFSSSDGFDDLPEMFLARLFAVLG